MGRKRKTIVEEDVDEMPADVPVENESDFGSDEDKRKEWLKAFQSQFTDQDIKILIEKREDTGDWAYCRKFPLENFDIEPIKEEWGAGRYRATLYDEQGHYIKMGRVQFRFAHSMKRDAPMILPKPENPLENPVVVMMLKAMEQQQANVMSMMQALITAQGPGGAGGTKAGLGELLEGVKALRGMVPNEGKPMDSIKEMLTIWKLFNDVNGKDESAPSREGLMGDIKEFFEILPMIKENLPALKTLAPVSASEVKPMSDDPVTLKFKEHLPEFIDAAKAQASITEWGQYLLDLFEDEFLPILTPVLVKKYAPFIRDEEDAYDAVVKSAQDAVEREKIFKAVPPLHEHRAWVLKVLDEAVRLSLIDPEETPPGGVGASGGGAPGGGSAILTTIESNGIKK